MTIVRRASIARVAASSLSGAGDTTSAAAARMLFPISLMIGSALVAGTSIVRASV
jgi:hypothetical protein